MDTILLLLQFACGLFLILKGADWLTDGASAIAHRFNVSTLVIGLTIVAFGTSMPEFVVSAIASYNNQTDMAIGNVVGSNIFNLLAITGIVAMFSPIVCSKGNIRYDVPLGVLSSMALFFMASDMLIDGTPNRLTRSEGAVLLCFFCVFLFYTFSIALKGNSQDASAETDTMPVMSFTKSLFLFLLGLATLIIGGEWLVSGASGIAKLLGLSEAIIAITVVAGGTSFPEMVASVIAARKGDTDMALGNVIGSNVFNVFLVLGASSLINPLTLGDLGLFDLGFLLFASVLLWIVCKFGKKNYTVSRTDGAILLIFLVLYFSKKIYDIV